MPTLNTNGIRVKRVRIRETPSDDFSLLKKMNCNETLVYSASQLITYKVDTGTTYTEEIEYGSSALVPTSFTPTKSGYTFVGWRTDNAASSSVLTEKDVDTEEFTLYAVFKRTVTLSFNGNGSTSGSVETKSGTTYYNNGNKLGATFTAPSSGFKRTRYAFSTWALGSASGTRYHAGDSISVTENTVAYAKWKAVTFTTSQFDIHGYGNSSYPNAVKEESETKTLISSIDLTGFSTISLYIGNFHSSDSIEYDNSHGAKARIKLSGTTVIEVSTHSESKTTGSGSYNCASITGSRSVQYCYYNMDGNCEAAECTLTFTSSGEEV